jgi:hypothetical protein
MGSDIVSNKKSMEKMCKKGGQRALKYQDEVFPKRREFMNKRRTRMTSIEFFCASFWDELLFQKFIVSIVLSWD